MDDSDQNLIEYLAEHEAVCPQCEYALAGLRISRCPECGVDFTIEQLKWCMNEFQAEQQVWFKTVQGVQLQVVFFAMVLLVDAVVAFLFLRMLSLGLILAAAASLLVFLPMTRKKHCESQFAIVFIQFADNWLSVATLLCSCFIIIAMVYSFLMVLGMM